MTMKSSFLEIIDVQNFVCGPVQQERMLSAPITAFE